MNEFIILKFFSIECIYIIFSMYIFFLYYFTYKYLVQIIFLVLNACIAIFSM